MPGAPSKGPWSKIANMQTDKQPIPPLPLATGALRVTWQRRDDALRLGMVPAIILFCGFAYGWESLARYWDLLGAGQTGEIEGALMLRVMALMLVSAISAAIVVANWLRFLLLGPMSAIGLGLSLGKNHVGFFAAMLALFLLLGMALAILSMPLAFLPGPLSPLSIVAVTIGLLVVFARQVFVPVSIAIGQHITPQRSWLATRGNGLRLAFALVLVELPLFLALNVAAIVLDVVGFAQAAPYAMMFIAACFQVAILIAQSSVIAAGYRHLIGIEA